jgi:hypothetical protein
VRSSGSGVVSTEEQVASVVGGLATCRIEFFRVRDDLAGDTDALRLYDVLSCSFANPETRRWGWGLGGSRWSGRGSRYSSARADCSSGADGGVKL